MKKNKYFTHTKQISSGARGAGLALALIASLGLCAPALAKKGGNGGGPGGGGGGGDGTTVADPLPAPITYQKTELRWADDQDPDYGGTFVQALNGAALAVGWVEQSDPDGNGDWLGVINLGENGEASDTLRDLNEIFALSLAALNADLDPGGPGWRIVRGDAINEAGFVACEMIPADAPAIDNSTVPIRTAVLNLTLAGSGNALTLIDPDNLNPKQLIMQMNENGDVIVSEGVAYVSGRYNRWGNRLYVNQNPGADSPTYVEVSIPQVTEWRPKMNSALEIASITYGNRAELFLYDINQESSDYLWSGSSKAAASTQGITETGDAIYIRDSGDNRLLRLTTTDGATTPLTNLPSYIPAWRNRISQAPTVGDEELLMVVGDNAEYQVYRPNFGRFVLEIPGNDPANPIDIGQVVVSPPHAPTSPGAYVGGYIAFEDWAAPINRAFILTPEGATVPDEISAP